jgi:hypothetical protein
MASDNPYQSPKTQSPAAKRSGPRLVIGILLLIAMVPSSAIAFFCCCLAGATAANPAANPGDAESAGLAAGAIGGLTAFVLMLCGGIWLIRRSRRLPSA